MSMFRLAAAAGFVLLVGCKDPDPVFHDAGVDAPVDAPVDAIDAAVPLPAYEVTGGARNVRGTRFSADVQIGHGIGQQPASGNGKQIQGNAAVKP